MSSEADNPSSPTETAGETTAEANAEATEETVGSATKATVETESSTVSSSIWSALGSLSEAATTLSGAAVEAAEATTKVIAEMEESALKEAETMMSSKSSSQETECTQASTPSSSMWSSTFESFNMKNINSGLETLSELKSSTADSLSLLTKFGNKPAEWVEKLEQENLQNDPDRKLGESLDAFIEANPTGSYEAWVEEWLQQNGWDEDTAVVDKSFFTEESNHRNLWNERNYRDGININDKNPIRAYVPVGGNGDVGGKEDERTSRKLSPKTQAGKLRVDDEKEIEFFDALSNGDSGIAKDDGKGEVLFDKSPEELVKKYDAGNLDDLT